MSTTEPVADNGVNVEHCWAHACADRRPRGGGLHRRASTEWSGAPAPRPLWRTRGWATPTATSRLQLHRRRPRGLRVRGQRPDPGRVVLVGLTTCLTAGVAAVAQNRNIQLNSVKATIEGDMNILGILGGDPEVRNGFNDIRVHFDIDADAAPDDIEALVAQSQKRSAVFDVVTNPSNVSVSVN